MTSALHAADVRASDTSYPWLTHYPKNVDWHQSFTAAPLYELLDSAVAKYGSRPATNFLGKTLTYNEIAKATERVAAGLQKLGVKKGSKVGLFLPNCPTFIIYYYAILKAGGTVVNYNPLYTPDELTFQIRDSDTALMVTLDLKVLFDKVEGLMKAGTLKRVIIASFPALLPGRSLCCSSSSRAKKWHTRANPRCPATSCWTPMCRTTTASIRKSTSTRATMSRCCSIRAAPPARRRAQC
jgi:long-chain acyl-CoA synthetase